MPPDTQPAASGTRRRDPDPTPGQAGRRGRSRRLAWALIACLCAGAAGAQPAPPDPAGSAPAIDWSTVDAGQAVLSNGGLRLSATVGQPDVPVDRPATAGGYRLRAGYWLTPNESDDRIFAHGFDLPN